MEKDHLPLPLSRFRYDLETDKLYSITWYKDHEEFYRYVPRGEPKKHTYHVEGVKVDVSDENGRTRVPVAKISFRGRGGGRIVGVPTTSNDKV